MEFDVITIGRVSMDLLTVDVTGNHVYNSTEGIRFYVRWRRTVTALIADNEVHDNERGIYCHNRYYVEFMPQVTGNRVYNNSGEGMRFSQQDGQNSHVPVLTLNEVYGNGSTGVYLQGNLAVDVLYNDVHDNGGTGLYLAAGDGSGSL